MQFSGKFGRVVGCRPIPLGLVPSLRNPGFDTGRGSSNSHGKFLANIVKVLHTMHLVDLI